MKMSSAVLTSSDHVVEGLPDLVDVPDEWADEDYYEHCVSTALPYWVDSCFAAALLVIELINLKW